MSDPDKETSQVWRQLLGWTLIGLGLGSLLMTWSLGVVMIASCLVAAAGFSILPPVDGAIERRSRGRALSVGRTLIALAAAGFGVEFFVFNGAHSASVLYPLVALALLGWVVSIFEAIDRNRR